MPQGTIVKVAGPLIVAEGMADCRMYDVVRVSRHRLVGEIIELRGDGFCRIIIDETHIERSDIAALAAGRNTSARNEAFAVGFLYLFGESGVFLEIVLFAEDLRGLGKRLRGIEEPGSRDFRVRRHIGLERVQHVCRAGLEPFAVVEAGIKDIRIRASFKSAA